MAIKYVLTFDLRIIYCKNINLRIGLKELNLENLNFMPYDEDPSIIDYGYELATDDVQDINNKVFSSKLGYQLSDIDMLWIEKFEKELKYNPSLLNNNKLTFNYLILKLLLIGFSEELAIDFITKYYESIEYGITVPEVYKIIDKINSFIEKKEFWISNKIYENRVTELNFLKKVLLAKRKFKFNFDFTNFKDEYFRLCYNSIIMENYSYNLVDSFLVKKPKKLEEQRMYLIEVYHSTIGSLLNELFQDDFMDFYSEDRFINSLVDEMTKVVNTFLDVILEESNK